MPGKATVGQLRVLQRHVSHVQMATNQRVLGTGCTRPTYVTIELNRRHY